MQAIAEIVKTLKAADNESTDSPYWLILDPEQNMSCNPHYMANGITGPFFSREDAEGHLSIRRYGFSKNAVVYCLSGYASSKYKNFHRGLKI